jgi:hypothetical protein
LIDLAIGAFFAYALSQGQHTLRMLERVMVHGSYLRPASTTLVLLKNRRV